MLIQDLTKILEQIEKKKITEQFFGSVRKTKATTTYIDPSFDSISQVIFFYSPSRKIYNITLKFKEKISITEVIALFDSFEIIYNTREGGSDFVYSFKQEKSVIKKATSGKLGKYLYEEGNWKIEEKDGSTNEIPIPEVKSIKLYFD